MPMLPTVIVIAIVALLAVWAVAIYNRLVRQRALVKEGFSGITVQLRRRADLVPNLVSTVQGYAAHEKGVLTEVTAHRADAPPPAALPPRRRPTTPSPACSGG